MKKKILNLLLATTIVQCLMMPMQASAAINTTFQNLSTQNLISKVAKDGAFATNVYAEPVGGYYCEAVTTYTYANLESDLRALTQQYSDVRYDSLATTVDGRNIYHVAIGNTSAPRQILVVGSIHGREYISSQLIMRQLHALLELAKTGGTIQGQSAAALLETTGIHFVPMNNPDGVSLSQFGLLAVQNIANRADFQTMITNYRALAGYYGTEDWIFRRWKNNIRGVDINRNFSTGWAALDDKTYVPSMDFFKGAAPESEPETKALISVLSQYHISEILNYHSQGNVIYWNCGSSPAGINEQSRHMAEIAKAATGYVMDGGSEGNKPYASYKEYASVCGIPSITLEVGSGSCPVPEAQINTIWSRNQNVLNALLYDINT